PIRPHMLPAGTSRSTPSSTWTWPMKTSRPVIVSMAQPSGGAVTLQVLADHVAADLLVQEDGIGRPLGDDAAVIEGEHAVGIALDYLHIVLDEQHRHLLFLQRADHDIHQPELL